jgi:hypothetical protein
MPRKRKAATSSCSVKLKRLADPTRLEVMRILLAGPRTVGGINRPFVLNSRSCHITSKS